MSQAAFPLMPPPSEASRISPTRPTSYDAQPRCVKAAPCRGSRNGQLPSTVPASPTPLTSATPLNSAGCEQDLSPKHALLSQRKQAKRQTLARLQAEIDRIERSQASSFVSSGVSQVTPVLHQGTELPWLSGDEAADAKLGVLGLERDATHEIKPLVASMPMVSSGATAGALAFALKLAVGLPSQVDPGREKREGKILFCATSHFIRETGRLYGPGLRGLGLAPERLVIAETAKTTDMLWALEEGLKSGALDAVVGCLDEIGLTPARRLSLAAKAYSTPCLMVTGARSASAGATASRWRIGVKPGARCPFDKHAPGDGGWRVQLEKLRRRGERAAGYGSAGLVDSVSPSGRRSG